MAKKTTTKKTPRRRKKVMQLRGTIKIDDLPEVVDPSIPTVWVDRMQVLARAEVATLRFQTALPEARYEVCRVQTSLGHLRDIVDVLCRTLEYYPTDPKKKVSKSKG